MPVTKAIIEKQAQRTIYWHSLRLILLQWCSPHTCSLITQRVSRGAPTITHLVAFLPERATFGQASPSSGRLAQHCGATPAENHSLGVAEHGCAARSNKDHDY